MAPKLFQAVFFKKKPCDIVT